MNTNWSALILILVCVIAGVTIQQFAALPVPEVVLQKPATTPMPQVSYAPIVPVSPLPNSVVASPLTLTGQAPGNWFFEASMPVDILDAQMNVLVSGYVTAQGDWMTTSLVPFSGLVSFVSTPNTTGFIRFKKDNPSGEPQNDASVLIPISF